VIDGCPAWIVAPIEERIPAGDHTLLLARVLHLGGRREADEPLLYHDGRFRRLSSPAGQLGQLQDRRASSS
jgi:flavin reductase (DIM6/NTAB) family NADH-FMN oxidoreductase RutF